MEKIWMKNWPDDLPRELSYPLGEIPVHEYLRKNAANHPDKCLVSFYGRDVSYREVDTASDRLANYLRSKGLKKGDRVGLFLGNKSRTYLTELRTRKPLKIKGFRVSHFTEQS